MEIKSRQTIYQGFFNVEQVTVASQGELLQRDVVVNRDAVAALVYNTQTREYLLAEQYRVPAQKQLVEVVAGLLDKENEDPEAAIKREITEELGYETDRLELIRSFYSTPGSYTEKIWLYYAEVSRQTGPGGGLAEEHEAITTRRFSRENLLAEPLEDAKTLIAVLWLQTRTGK